jgi:hypothetical protein
MPRDWNWGIVIKGKPLSDPLVQQTAQAGQLRRPDLEFVAVAKMVDPERTELPTAQGIVTALPNVSATATTCLAGKTLTTTGKLVTMGRRSSIAQGPMIVVLARSNPNAVQRRRSAKSRAASTRRRVMLPGRWPRRRRSSSHAATGSVLRCCLHI